MPDRKVPPAEKYAALKLFVRREGRLRLNAFGAQSRFRDQLIEWAVEEWPDETDAARLEETLRARLSIRTREKYGSVLAAFLIPVLVNVIVHLVVKWWESRRDNRAQLSSWVADAKASEG